MLYLNQGTKPLMKNLVTALTTQGSSMDVFSIFLQELREFPRLNHSES